MDRIKIGVCGATGYSGIELLKLLKRHSYADVVFLTSETKAGKTVLEGEPSLTDYHGMKFLSAEDPSIYGIADAVFLCLPHEASAETAPKFLDKGAKVIDLSAAYRIEDTGLFEKVYKFSHPSPGLIRTAVYGLPEIYPEEVKKAALVANPGCYPTCVLMPVMPLLKDKTITADNIIADCKSGISGAGRKAVVERMYPEINENLYAYNIGTHRHRPEIAQELSKSAGKPVKVTFIPHVAPMDRGILSTIYIQGGEGIRDKVLDKLESFYHGKPFVKIYRDVLPQVKWATYTNKVLIGAQYDGETGYLVIVSAIDNLIKGAAGQALQNMNLMFGIPETEGLI
ncbi:MAG: N-acetyl-gamma-glutamyl-phosphate reductase [Spirochaetes bacterium GWF1_51_8]|nr:MAG: N-acetyl-gamma-glutamyl-phosphate reductase [Spirochaetes bacterium GWF1_51_8]